MRRVLLLVVAAGLLGACSSDGSSGGSGQCTSIAGDWSLSGSCADSSCTVAQNGCAITVTCHPSGQSYSGGVEGSSMAFSGGGQSCSGSLTGATGSGTCSASQGSCSWTASCVGGACLGGAGE